MQNTIPGLTTAIQKINRLFLIVSAMLLLTSCNTETIFQSDFSATPLNNPPATTQQVGTIQTDGPSGNIKVVASPIGNSDKWVQIIRTSSQQSVTGMQCNISKFIGDGEYTFSSLLYIPSGSGLVTIQFEPFAQSAGTLVNFLHIDFTQDNHVRIDDNNATSFGSFLRNQAFMVTVTLKITDINTTAHIALGGADASGAADYTIPAPFHSLSRQFGAVRLWIGFPWSGSFDATTIVVTHKTN